MPTNYRNDRSSQKFASACSSLSKLLERIALTRKSCVIMGDFNTDINDNTIVSPESGFVVSATFSGSGVRTAI